MNSLLTIMAALVGGWLALALIPAPWGWLPFAAVALGIVHFFTKDLGKSEERRGVDSFYPYVIGDDGVVRHKDDEGGHGQGAGERLADGSTSDNHEAGIDGGGDSGDAGGGDGGGDCGGGDGGGGD